MGPAETAMVVEIPARDDVLARRKTALVYTSVSRQTDEPQVKVRVAKLFSNGGSQAVRLPADFRFDGDEVLIRRDPITGDVVLSSKPDSNTWARFFAVRDSEMMEPDFLDERPGNEPLEVRDHFAEAH